MKMIEVLEKARTMGLVGVSKTRKTELIRRIQRAEGNFDCFASHHRSDCRQTACCWRKDCLTAPVV